ncbi:MAG: GNAT family N-acetyltransferase [Clostridia bacterium]|nr:GNAT family N-acetyltransferase [Clostridia bacterium]
MTEYRKALPHEEADILDFINCIFSMAKKPHDFKKLGPKVYNHEGFHRYHYVAVEEGRIRGTVAVLPLEMPLGGGEVLKIGYVGSVSVHPYHRGHGCMKELMNMMLRDAGKQYDLLVLGGQRQRYQYYGFEGGGSRLTFEVTQKNVRHALADVETKIKLRKIECLKDASLDEIHAMCAAQPMTCVRDRGIFLDIMRMWESELYALEDENGLQGYLYAMGNDYAAEIGLKDESRIGEVIKAFMQQTGEKKITVWADPLNRIRANYIRQFCDDFSLSDSEMLRVINWKHTLEALLRYKAECVPLLDGRFVFEVEDERFAIEIKDHAVSVRETADQPDMVMTRLKAQEFFFSPYTAWMTVSPLLKSWLPVPFAVYPADGF